MQSFQVEHRKGGKMKARIKKHVARLRTLARRNRGKLPTYSWLNAHGYFGSYDIVRAAGLLKNFKRAYAR